MQFDLLNDLLCSIWDVPQHTTNMAKRRRRDAINICKILDLSQAKIPVLSGACYSSFFLLQTIEMKPFPSGHTVLPYNLTVFYPAECVSVALGCSPQSESVRRSEQEWRRVSIQSAQGRRRGKRLLLEAKTVNSQSGAWCVSSGDIFHACVKRYMSDVAQAQAHD